MKRIACLEESKLFARLSEAPTDDDEARRKLAANVGTVVTQSKWISAQIVRTLPQYTLHNETHLFNVLAIMERLLPEATRNHLSPLECALCILAAFTHDLGMALSDEEHRRLLDDTSQNKGRREFLRHRSEHCAEQQRQIEHLYRQGTEGSRRKAAILEGHILADFLRRTHAANVERVAAWLTKIKEETRNQALFTYGNLDFEHHLALIAISHNQEAHWLREQLNRTTTSGRHDAFFSLAGGEHVNFALPGVLLRLADAMDFDASRAPGILFHHFGIDDTISVREWEKHMAISGWELDCDEQPPRLIYQADGCNHPVFEKTIRSFAHDIEQEARKSHDELDYQRTLLKKRGTPYHLFIPGRVEPRITPRIENGRPCYLYHDWQFRLDQDEIQQLLMGETLYGDPSLAIRELLQNSLDALQIRDLRLQLLGKDPTAQVEPADPLAAGEELAVRLTWGRDAQSDQEFIRVSDNGSGMVQRVLEKFFTQLGKSYYRSPDYQREQTLLRAHGYLATPISQFGIGILSCFMIGDRLEVRTRPGHADDHDRRAYDLTVSGPGSLFWLRPGTLERQGTEVTVYLKSRFRLATDMSKLVPALRQHFGYETFDLGLEKKLMPDGEGKGEGKTIRLNPAFVAAKHIIWPLYPLLLGDDENGALMRMDDFFHFSALNPIAVDKIMAKAKEWGCPANRLGQLRWETFDWIDEEGDEATGSRIRIVFPRHFGSSIHGPDEPPPALSLCRQDEVASFVEATLRNEAAFSRIRHMQVLVKGIHVEEHTGIVHLFPVTAGIGAYLWVDLRGKAIPCLTVDRKKAFPPADEEEWQEEIDGLFARWMRVVTSQLNTEPKNAACWQYQLSWDKELYPLSTAPVPAQFVLTGAESWPETKEGHEDRPSSWRLATLWQSLTAGARFAPYSGWDFVFEDNPKLENTLRQLNISFQPDTSLSLAHLARHDLTGALQTIHKVELIQPLYPHLNAEQAAELFRDFRRSHIRYEFSEKYPERFADLDQTCRENAALYQRIFVDSPSRAAYEVEEDLAEQFNASVIGERDAFSEHSTKWVVHLRTGGHSTAAYQDALNYMIVNDAFFPNLEQSFPLLGCGALRGYVGNGQLNGPGIVDFTVAADGRTVINAGPDEKLPAAIAKRGYDLVFPLYCVPLGRLRQTSILWREVRSIHRIGTLPFLLLGHDAIWAEHAQILGRVLQVPSILALFPRRDLWDKPFAEWTQQEWRTCGLTALWDIPTGRVLWATGAHTEKGMRRVGKPIPEFIKNLAK